MASRRPVRIAPSILSADFSRLGEQVAEAERAGADIIHVDVMDGRFVPNITVGPLVVRALRPVTRLPLHVHLMIVEPERHIDAFARAGADLITVHVETCPHLDHPGADSRCRRPPVGNAELKYTAGDARRGAGSVDSSCS